MGRDQIERKGSGFHLWVIVTIYMDYSLSRINHIGQMYMEQSLRWSVPYVEQKLCEDRDNELRASSILFYPQGLEHCLAHKGIK